MDKSSKTGKRCAAPGCNSVYSPRCGKSFFSFPKDPIRCYKWLQFFQLEHRYQQAADVREFVICSDHFNKDDYYCRSKPTLSSGSIPTISASKRDHLTKLSTQTPVDLPSSLSCASPDTDSRFCFFLILLIYFWD
ncbi:hypothetical protein C0J52_25423 [Blattella germanica]|nr:hypothetical protein C0J52_25423 [Blattella germanica]